MCVAAEEARRAVGGRGGAARRVVPLARAVCRLQGGRGGGGARHPGAARVHVSTRTSHLTGHQSSSLIRAVTRPCCLVTELRGSACGLARVVL